MSASIVYTLSAGPFPQSGETEGEALARTLPLTTFSDVAWDFEANDIETPKRIIRGVDVIVQNLRIRLRLWLGTWFLDLNVGIPKDRVYGKNKDPRVIRELFTRVVLSVPGIVRVEDLNVTIDNATRRAFIGEFRAILGTGQALTLDPFYV